jgi:hypothetical protein
MRRSILVLLLALTRCATSPDPFATTASPPFDPLGFFTGHVHSWGVIEDRGGAPTGIVQTDCQGTRSADGSLKLMQHLALPDGKTQERDWTMRQTGPATYEATANDMVGPTQGVVSGPSLHWTWTWARSPGNPLANLTMDQWMYRLPDGAVMIRTTISKLGITLAEVSEQFVHTN